MAEMLGKASGLLEGQGRLDALHRSCSGPAGRQRHRGSGRPARRRGGPGGPDAGQQTGRHCTFFGEGAVNQGVFHETLNLIAVWKLPVILVCENNLYSEMTPSHETTSTVETWKRAAAYGIQAQRVDGNDVEAMYQAVA